MTEPSAKKHTHFIDHLEVKKYLPHRYPFILVDTVEDYNVEKKTLIAKKNITCNEPYFAGHFPAYPVVPGVLIVESLAQASGILIYRILDRYPGDDLFFLAGIENTRFKRKVVPGDQLMLHVEVTRQRENLWKFKGEAFVDGELACYSEFMNIKA